MRDLYEEFNRLNPEQQRAVEHEGNVVVLAGPGSGKTATLVVKVAHLLSTSVRPPQGLACITYSNDAADEFRARLAKLGVLPDGRVFCGTVHSFCLNAVLRPFAHLVLPSYQEGMRLCLPKQADALLAELLHTKYRHVRLRNASTLTLARRRIICDEDVSDLTAELIQICHDYRQQLQQRGEVDFEEMVALTLEVMRDYPWLPDAVGSRFRWVLVDEYQDLGGPLHRIVCQLLDSAGVNVFAVGDPHQTIYPFAGADSRYLMELRERRDFAAVTLRFNYRSGRRLILASQAALAPEPPVNYEPDPMRVDDGEVYIEEVTGGLEAQAQHIIRELLPRLDGEIPLHEIAILYRSKGEVLDCLRSALCRADVPCLWERDERYPRTAFVRWLQNCAAWCLSEYSKSDVLFDTLCNFLHDLQLGAEHAPLTPPSLDLRRQFYETLVSLREPELSFETWLKSLDSTLGLRPILEKFFEHAEALDDLKQLLYAASMDGCLAGYCVRDFVNEANPQGKVVLTTLHGSKGRQFDAVIMPGLQEGIIPERRWQNGQYTEPSLKDLVDNRRLFYVGLTRARKYAFLLYSPSYRNSRGYSVNLGPSRFVMQIKRTLEAEETIQIPF